jgi:hypothetical protein
MGGHRCKGFRGMPSSARWRDAVGSLRSSPCSCGYCWEYPPERCWTIGTGSHQAARGGGCEWLAVTVFAFREPLGVPGAVTWTSPLTAAHCGTGVVYSRLEL